LRVQPLPYARTGGGIEAGRALPALLVGGHLPGVAHPDQQFLHERQADPEEGGNLPLRLGAPGDSL
jgi:hypothetical protein